MNLQQYREWRLTAVVPAEVLDIMDAAYSKAYGGAAIKGMTAVRKPFSGKLYTMPAGRSAPPTQSSTTRGAADRDTVAARCRRRWEKQIDVGVRQAFQKAGLLCFECGEGLDEAALARVCSRCVEDEEE